MISSFVDEARPAHGAQLAPARLGELVGQVAADGHWPTAVMFDASRHWYRRLDLTESYEIWLLAWLPGQHTGFHDHGAAAGAFTVVRGELAESLAAPGSRRVRRRTARTGSVTAFGPNHLHDVGNDSAAPAVSVHAYSPPLTAMRRYAMTTGGLALVRTDLAEQDW
jgi:predicted metal-dependent enzyme (double-stranded beta helix superfamily)